MLPRSVSNGVFSSATLMPRRSMVQTYMLPGSPCCPRTTFSNCPAVRNCKPWEGPISLSSLRPGVNAGGRTSARTPLGEPVGCRKSIRPQWRPYRTSYDQPPSMLLCALDACLPAPHRPRAHTIETAGPNNRYWWHTSSSLHLVEPPSAHMAFCEDARAYKRTSSCAWPCESTHLWPTKVPPHMPGPDVVGE